MDTFEKTYRQFPAFAERIASWEPDYVVPVVQKGYKLLRAAGEQCRLNKSAVRVRKHFELFETPLQGMRIAVLDDASQYTSTLLEYRSYFEQLGAKVRTFSFVGHDSLFKGSRWQYDSQAEIEVFLPEPVYQEYLLQQSRFLLQQDSHFDLDHVVFSSRIGAESFEQFISDLRQVGTVLFIEDSLTRDDSKRFAITDIGFDCHASLGADASITSGSVCRIKCVYHRESGCIRFTPLIFPTWNHIDCVPESGLIRSPRFRLPFPVENVVRDASHRAQSRAYQNLLFSYTVCLAKKFFQLTHELNVDIPPFEHRHSDWATVYGEPLAQELAADTQEFLESAEHFEFKGEKEPLRTSLVRAPERLADFESLLHHLKKNYELEVKRQQTRVGVHFGISYDSLYRAGMDPYELAEGLDHFCDLGILVPVTIVTSERIERGCRTGEPDPEYSWHRSVLLVALAIEQITKASSTGASEVPAMVLMKLLACFVFDFPMQSNRELHCLTGKPYTFGAFVYFEHSVRAPTLPSLYSVSAPFFSYDSTNRRFRLKDRRQLFKRVKDLFDEREEVPYTEIVTYMNMLALIAAQPKGVANLNSLSICREENYFYSHVVYNLKRWLEEFSNFVDSGTNLTESLHEAGKQVSSAKEKLRLAVGLPSLMDRIRSKFGDDIDYVKSLERLERNTQTFTDRFSLRLTILEEIASLEHVAVNLALALTGDDSKRREYIRELEVSDWRGVLMKSEVNLPSDLDLLHSSEVDVELFKHCGRRVADMLAGLPREEPLMATRLQSERYARGRNIALSVARNREINEFMILFADLSGLREIADDEGDVLGEFYFVVEDLIHQRSGAKLYGGQGGNDAFSVLFTEFGQAIEFCRDLKKEFGSNLLLAKYDIKFGLSYIVLGEKPNQDVARGWGLAKDCCEYRSESFKNRGDLILDARTLDMARIKHNDELARQFEQIPDSESSTHGPLFRNTEPFK